MYISKSCGKDEVFVKYQNAMFYMNFLHCVCIVYVMIYITLSFFLNIIVVTPFSSKPDAAVMSSWPPQKVSTRGVDLNNRVDLVVYLFTNCYLLFSTKYMKLIYIGLAKMFVGFVSSN